MSVAGPKPGDVNAAVVAEDRVCLSCGYLLRGLPMSGVCPECGTAVVASLRGPYLRYEEAGYLRDLARGVAALRRGTQLQGIFIITLLVVAVIFGAISAAGLATRLVLVLMTVVMLGLWVLLPLSAASYLTGCWLITRLNRTGHSIFEDWNGRIRWSSPAAVLLGLAWFGSIVQRRPSLALEIAVLSLTTLLVVGFVVHLIAIRRGLATLHARTGAFVPRDRRLHRRAISGPVVLGVMMLVVLWLDALTAGSPLGTRLLNDGTSVVVVLWFLAMIALGSVIRPVAAAVAGEVAASRELAQRGSAAVIPRSTIEFSEDRNGE